jgi:hypothetical protein
MQMQQKIDNDYNLKQQKMQNDKEIKEKDLRLKEKALSQNNTKNA